MTAREHEALLYCVGLVAQLTNSYHPPDIANDQALKDRAFEKSEIARTALTKIRVTS